MFRRYELRQTWMLSLASTKEKGIKIERKGNVEYTTSLLQVTRTISGFLKLQYFNQVQILNIFTGCAGTRTNRG
jgi:hypothetical protein